MTKKAKKKQARHNAEKDAKRRMMSVDEFEREASYHRKVNHEALEHVQSISDNINEIFLTWQNWFCRYTVPRLCAGFYYSSIIPAKKRLIKSASQDFLDEVSANMQEVIDRVCNDGEVDLDLFEYYKEKIEAEGYEMPLWAEKSDLDEDMKETYKRLGLPMP